MSETTVSTTGTACSITSLYCKHRTPCGWCELKNAECNGRVVYQYPYYYQQDWERVHEPNMVSVYAAPSGAPIIGDTIRYDSSHPFADDVMMAERSE